MTRARAELERKVAIKRELKKRRALNETVYGIVCPNDGLLRCWQRNPEGEFVGVDKTPQVMVPVKLEKILTVKKKYKILYGGRGSAKSMTAMDLLASEAKDLGSSTMCFREVQKSLKESIFKGISGEINRLGFEGFTPVESAGEIRHENGALFSFWGLKSNMTNMKSLYGYKRFLTEEAEDTSQASIDIMGPTLRGVPDAEMWFIFNPKSREAPISKRFLMPYMHKLMADGYYEDDHHLIIKVNWRDNPWFMNDKSLREEMENDKQRVIDGAMSQEKFDHIWEGEFDDHIDSALIPAPWFDACVDSHKKLGFEPSGFKYAAHDPSDEGPDPKGYAMRHGSVVMDVQELDKGNIHSGGDWACELAKLQGVDRFTWDGDGMGVGLRRDVSKNLHGTHIKTTMFRGSEGCDSPDRIYAAVSKHEVGEPRTNKQTFKNKRAQYYSALRDKCYNTWKAVTTGVYTDPDTMISFSSDMPLLLKLRSELCKMPIKENNNGLIELYTKEQMKRLFQLPSPNLADCVMMLQRTKQDADQAIGEVHMPQMIDSVRMGR